MSFSAGLRALRRYSLGAPLSAASGTARGLITTHDGCATLRALALALLLLLLLLRAALGSATSTTAASLALLLALLQLPPRAALPL